MKPSIKVEYGGKIFREVGSRLFPNRNLAETDDEFLIFFLGQLLSPEWVKLEIQKPAGERHELINHYQSFLSFLADNVKSTRTLATGTVWSLLTLAYDLYCLSHTSNLSDEMLRRLKDYNEYEGCLYEVRIAAVFARLGYKITILEDVNKHGEFLVERNDVKIVIEVKTRSRKGVRHTPGSQDHMSVLKTGIHRKFNEALKQNNLQFPFLIFIDLNIPVEQNVFIPIVSKPWWKDLRKTMDKTDETADNFDGFNALFVTSFSPHYLLNTPVDVAKFRENVGLVISQKSQYDLDFKIVDEIHDEISRIGEIRAI